MPALGHNGSLQMVKEVTWGTDPGSGYTGQPVTGETLETKQAYLWGTPVQGTREVTAQKVLAGVTASGGISFDADVEGILGMCLKGILIGETYATNGLGNGGTHTFAPTSEPTAVPSFSILVNRDNVIGAAGNVWDYVGSTVDKLSLSASEGQLLKASATFSSKSGAPSATAVTPTYATQMPLVYRNGTFTVGGVATALKSFKLDIDSGNYNKRGQLGSQYIQQQQPGALKVTGSLSAYFDNMTLLTDYLNGTDAILSMAFTGAALGTSTRGLTILIPVAQFTGKTPNIKGAASEIMLDLPFTAWLSGSGSPNHLIQATLINSQQSAY